MSFARTKIQPPRQRSGRVARPALEAALSQALAHVRLTLVSAPAGFGKSVAVAGQLERLGDAVAVAWVSVDEDDDLPRLLECLFAALEPYDLPWRQAPESLAAAVGHSRESRRAVATQLVNTLAATEVERGLLVFDDLHRTPDPAVHEFLELVLEHLPEHWGVVVSTRVDPDLPLARMRASGDLAEFRARELQFGHEEVTRLCALVAGQGQPIATPADVDLLLTRSGGWAAGLRLALASAAGRPRGGGEPGIGWESAGRTMDRHVFDYLAAEVLDAMPAALRDFLLRCSVLAELTVAACSAVSGDARAAQWLTEVERRELFVSVLEGSERAWRLHDLFRDFLDDRLRRDHPEELPTLLRRAAAVEDDPIRRVLYLQRAEAWTEAAEALAAEGLAMLSAGANDALVRLIDHFPAEVRQASHTLQRLRGLAAWARWDWAAMVDATQCALAAAGNEAETQVARAYTVLALTGIGRRTEARALLGRIDPTAMPADARPVALLGRIWEAFDDCRFGELPALLDRQLDLLEHSDSVPLWYQCVPVPSYLGMPGMHAPLQRYVQGALARAPAGSATTLRAMARGLQGGLLYTLGQLDEALEVLRDAERDLRWLGQPLNASSMIYGQLALVHTARGERETAFGLCELHLQQNRREGDANAAARLAFIAYCAGRMALALGDEDAARGFFAQATERAAESERPALARHRRALPGYEALLAGDLDGAIAGFSRALEEADAIDLFGHASELRLRLAWALLQRGRATEAAAQAQRVLARQRATTEVSAVLIAGPQLLGALAGADWQGALPAADQAPLAAWHRLAESKRATPTVTTGSAPATVLRTGRPAPALAGTATQAASPALPDDLGGPLSPRELEVLARIAAGDSNKLIARALDLSPHTVKRHVANILDKLGLASRGQASAWYQSR
ncbi:MAG: LuxR C-terminal-related transcriptional regulator [Pseudomonadota bacterium]